MKIILTPKDELAAEKIKGYEFEGKVKTLKPIMYGRSFYIVELPSKLSKTSKMIIYVRVSGDEDFDYKIVEEDEVENK